MLQQPGILRPKQSGWAYQNGRDLPLCYSLAFRDRFSAESRLKMVGICHATTARQIPTTSLASPAFHRFSVAAGPLAPPAGRPALAAGPPASRRVLPIGRSTQIETFVATQDAQLFG